MNRAALVLFLCVAGCGGSTTLQSPDGGADSGSISDGGGDTGPGQTEGGGSAGCSSSSQCNVSGQAPQECAAGGVVTGCGGPSPCDLNTPCDTDSQCGDAGQGMVCQTAVCKCQSYAGLCAPGCTDSSQCGAGYSCQASHCVPTPCSTDLDCTTNYVCDPSSHTCQVKACQKDSDCRFYCIDNLCASKPGVCVPEPV